MQSGSSQFDSNSTLFKRRSLTALCVMSNKVIDVQSAFVLGHRPLVVQVHCICGGWPNCIRIHIWACALVFIHPSIFYRLIRRSGHGGAGAYPSSLRAIGGVRPGQVASPSQGHRSRSTRREPTHTRGEHANSTQKGLKGGDRTWNLEPSHCDGANHHTTVQPHSFSYPC